MPVLRDRAPARPEPAWSLPARGRRRDAAWSSVCLVTDSEEPSGVGEHMLALVRQLRPHCRVALACSSVPNVRPFRERVAALGIETLALDWRGADGHRRFGGWLADREFGLCHVHAGIFWEGLPIAGTAKRAGVPVVIRTEHLPFVSADPGERARYGEAMREVDRVVCVSREARDSFLAAGLPPERFAVIRNGAPPPPRRSHPLAVRASLGLDPADRVVLTVARYTEQKDHRTLLAALPLVLDRVPRARFVWVGAGPLETTMIEAARQNGLDRHVMFLGRRRDVAELMSAADLFALPSRFEGLPLAVLEAMAAGLPVVATRVCGTAEAVRHGLTGLLVEPGRPDLLAAALVEILTEPDWAAQLGRRGKARASRCFSAARMARETLALYDETWLRMRAAMKGPASGRLPAAFAASR